MAKRRLGPYEIVEELGEGGMGVVFKAKDTRLDRFVAIKVLRADTRLDDERRRRFVQEARSASALNHPNIVTIHDIASDQGTDYIVMEYAHGKTLDRLIGGRLRLRDLLNYASQAADALARAHAAGIVHRDLKPSNLMVTDDQRVKILDFGLAKLMPVTLGPAEATMLADPLKTGDGRVVGTPAYMSPEQAEGKAVDVRSDIFSFGAVLYEMATGRQRRMVRSRSRGRVGTTCAGVARRRKSQRGCNGLGDQLAVVARNPTDWRTGILELPKESGEPKFHELEPAGRLVATS